MSIRTAEEEKRILEKQTDRKRAFLKFREDFMTSFLLGIKVGGILTLSIIVLYLIAKWIFKWDLFYETDLNYSTIVFVLAVFFAALILLCVIIAFILYNNKHKRNTKYTSVKKDMRD